MDLDRTDIPTKSASRTRKSSSSATHSPGSSRSALPKSDRVTRSSANAALSKSGPGSVSTLANSISDTTLRTQSTADHDIVSDTASNASSHRGPSPFSAPATPATAFSTATTVSSSARPGKRAREEENAIQVVQNDSRAAPSQSPPEPARSRKGKGKAREASSAPATKRFLQASNPEQRPTASGSSSASSAKGKKRAKEPSPSLHQSLQHPQRASKRQKRDSTGSYNLRPRVSDPEPATASHSAQTTKMAPKKAAPSSPTSASANVGASMAKGKGKGKGRAARGSSAKMQTSASASQAECSHENESQSDIHERRAVVKDEDVEMRDDTGAEVDGEDAAEAEGLEDENNDDEDEDLDPEASGDGMEEENEEDDDDDDDDGDEGDEGPYDDDGDDGYEGARDGGAGGAYGLNLRAMAGYMSGLSSRFRTLLSSLRARKDPTAQLVALQELSELLSVSTEDTLAGYFPTDAYVKELIYLMGGPKPRDSSAAESSSGDDNAAKVEEDEETATANAAASAGLEDNGETMLLACRCLANLMEAMPYAAHSVVSNGAVPVLNEKLMEIQFIDLAEQVLQTLEKISIDYPGAIVREGGLGAMLSYLDFFNMHVQRTAMTAAANCCRKLSTDSLPMIRNVMPIIQNVLSYSDQRLVESACKCVVRVVESYKHHPDLLETILENDLIDAVNALLLPASSAGATPSTSVSTSTYTDVLKALSTAARASPRVAVALLENNVVETLYHLLTGSPAPAEDGSGGQGPASIQNSPHTRALELEKDGAAHRSANAAAVAVVPEAGGGVAVADMAVLQNLAHRPKEQVHEALSLVGELLPPLPRDGVFDARQYTEKASLKKKARSEKAARDVAKAAASKADPSAENCCAASPTKDVAHSHSTEANKPSSKVAADASPSSGSAKTGKGKSERELAKEAAQARRIEMLHGRERLVRRFTQLVLPTLVEVYAASVALHVRTKAMSGILKIISFVEPEALKDVLKNVPLASFIAAILSSRDHPSLVLNSLQMVELLLNKLPQVYRSSLRREGVMWEIDDIAAHETRSVKVKKEEDGKARQEAKEPLSLPGFSTTSSDQAAQAAGDRSADSLGSTASAGLARLLAKTSGSDGAIGAERASSAAVPALSGLFSASKTAVPTAVEAEDANIWRARALRERFAHEAAAATGSDTAIEALDEIKSLVSALDAEAENDKTAARSTVERIAALFTKRDDPVSSFELLRSGLVEGLYSFATKGSDVLPLEERRALLLDVFMVDDNSSTSAFTVLVRRLQESLSRLENVEITTAISSGTEETRRSPTSLMGRQLRLRLVAEDSTDIPRSCTNIVVSIHAIATFQNLDEYLRPKLAASAAAAAGGSSSAASRLSGVLAAFAAATGGLSGALPGSSATGTSRALSALAAEASTSGNEKSKDDSTSGSAAQESNHDSGKASGSTAPRRSSRLSGKGIDAEDIADTEAEPAHPDEKSGSPSHSPKGKAPDTSAESSDLPEGSDEAMARRLVEGLLQEGMDDDQFSEEEYDEEIFEDDLPEGPTGAGPDVSRAEDKTINVDVASDGSKVEAKTPDGTRVATPSNDAGAGSPSQRAAAGSSRPSYAAALQKKPTDWHLEFSMGETSLPLDTTIYGAVHKLETRSSQVSQRYIWSNVYTVKFKKVAGPAQTASDKATPEPLDTDSATVTLPASVPPGAPYAKLLQLLRVLHDLNSEWREFRPPYASDNKAVALGEAAFVNNKLTAKLNRQLEEPMIVASSCLPDWSKELPRYFPFLFPFETRYSFLQSTSFGYARLINKWQSLHSRQQGSTSRHDDSFGFLARLPRQKVRISRARLLESAFKVFELYGSSSSLLEVEYYEEVGTGLGPTLEFYSLVSKEFARKNLDVWRNDGSSDNEYVFSPTGLFPAPIVDKDLVTEAGRKRLNTFKTLGQFVAKALLDSRIIDCNFSPIFMKLVLNQPVPTTLASLKIVDATLAQSLESLQKMDASDIHELGLDFTLPGFTEIELHANGKDEMVTAASLDLYIREVVEMTLLHGVKPFVRAFRQGFNTIFPISAMSSFTADELVMLFGNTNEDWSESTLVGSIKPDHGLNADSPTFKDIVAIMASFSVAERRDFLQWLTGSPKLPIGGFGGLHPQLTIVKRPHESPLVPDDYLPSVMTCVNYLKMPLYSTRDVMRTRLEKAMREGSTSFHLS